MDVERRDRGRQSRECGVCVPSSKANQGKEEEGTMKILVRSGKVKKRLKSCFPTVAQERKPQIFTGKKVIISLQETYSDNHFSSLQGGMRGSISFLEAHSELWGLVG